MTLRFVISLHDLWEWIMVAHSSFLPNRAVDWTTGAIRTQIRVILSLYCYNKIENRCSATSQPMSTKRLDEKCLFWPNFLLHNEKRVGVGVVGVVLRLFKMMMMIISNLPEVAFGSNLTREKLIRERNKKFSWGTKRAREDKERGIVRWTEFK